MKARDVTKTYGTFKPLGETEVVDNNLNPQWVKHFLVTYRFQADTELWFQVWNYNNVNDKDLIGDCKFMLSDLMTNSQQSITSELLLKGSSQKRGTLRVWADAIKKTDDIINF